MEVKVCFAVLLNLDCCEASWQRDLRIMSCDRFQADLEKYRLVYKWNRFSFSV